MSESYNKVVVIPNPSFASSDNFQDVRDAFDAVAKEFNLTNKSFGHTRQTIEISVRNDAITQGEGQLCEGIAGHGSVSYADFPSCDTETAVKFYNELGETLSSLGLLQKAFVIMSYAKIKDANATDEQDSIMHHSV